MDIIAGTHNGLYRVKNESTIRTEKILDSGDTINVFSDDEIGILAASKTGLYHSEDGGDSWTNLSVPTKEVFSVTVSPDQELWYAGTHPSHIYASSDGGESWSELEGFNELPSRGTWHTPRHRNKSHVRSLAVHPDSPSKVIAGVEVGGVHISNDYGATWEEKRKTLINEREDDLQYDVHHVLAISDIEFVISCGGGLYHTTDDGDSWVKLDVDSSRPYSTSSCYHDSKLFVAVQPLPPSLPFGDSDSRGPNGAMWVSDDLEEFDREPYPGESQDYIYSWATRNNQIFAGTTRGHVLISAGGVWRRLAHLPDWIRSMTVH